MSGILQGRRPTDKAAQRKMTALSGVPNVQSATIAECTDLNDCRVTTVMARTERVRGACAIDGCYHLVDSHGWCSRHYQRWLRWGDPLKTLTTRFEPKFRGRK